MRISDWSSGVCSSDLLPDETRLFTGHDYMPGGRKPLWESSVAEQKATNTHLTQARTEAEFVALRNERAATLPLPKLLLHALQVNLRGGRLAAPEAKGKRYLKVPLDALPGAPGDFGCALRDARAGAGAWSDPPGEPPDF